jgi:DNA-binding transcriptional LysR family regulator
MRTSDAKTDHLLGWDDLRTALFLARGGSVRSAARTLGVSHSTILRRVAALERSAGVRLFEKKPDGYELTPAGQDVFETARDLEELVTALERRVHGRDLRLVGAVRVTLPDPFLPALVPTFQSFARAYPDIEVTLAIGTGYADLAHREADIAIRTAAEPPPDLVGRRVLTAGVGIYSSKQYLRRRRAKDLEALDWVGWEAGSQMAFARWMVENVPKARVRLRVSHGWALRDAVDAGIGVAIVPCALGEAREGWQRVRLVPDVAAPVWILTHKDLRTTTRVRVLRDFLTDAIVAKRHVFEGR